MTVRLDTPFVVLPLHDPTVDGAGFDPRSRYVELFWLAHLGPTTTLLLRRLADGLDAYPDGFELDLAGTARALGLQLVGARRMAFQKALERCVVFGLARQHSHGLLVRRLVPPLSARQIQRLPDHLQQHHRAWAEPVAPTDELARWRAGALAQVLVDAGEESEAVERALERLGVSPALAAAALRSVSASAA